MGGGGSHTSLGLGSPLLQAVTNPHGHHLRVAVVVKHNEGMVHKVVGCRPLFRESSHALCDEVNKRLTELAHGKKRRILINDALQ